ncbi:hypothetical protein [Glaesserella parasuis]|uniref:Uncharacterized protein n=3 Tax=Glaesserella parasuis TaxID=738 RepID=A0A836MDY0_GLAPU|nr:hypothetical protein [Glaesserella parasuis]KDB47584.1 hypothetical protein HPS10_06285 [Glaesserella parasuis HPS10]MDD2169978.1 hypothetical protein [Glaesserella parasuis]MDE3959848.1 hypothetical protein [Glaesserella parasuis]MDE3961345.1 hypothetical protein [Glaesserella parasuis]MDE3980504.1 hypothetical protein [Glaesserella parasuis]
MENFQMQIDFSVMEGICKMLELMDKSKIAKRYVWAISLLIIMCVMMWLTPDFLKALADFILTLKNA